MSIRGILWRDAASPDVPLEGLIGSFERILFRMRVSDEDAKPGPVLAHILFRMCVSDAEEGV